MREIDGVIANDVDEPYSEINQYNAYVYLNFNINIIGMTNLCEVFLQENNLWYTKDHSINELINIIEEFIKLNKKRH